jgi:hypothetical protein
VFFYPPSLHKSLCLCTHPDGVPVLVKSPGTDEDDEDDGDDQEETREHNEHDADSIQGGLPAGTEL